MNQKKIKIFVDCHVFDGGFQGTRTYIQGLYLELIKLNKYHIYLACNDVENLKSVFGEQDNVTYLKYKSHKKYYRLLIDAPRLIKANKIDYAHFQYRVPPFKFCKYIVSIHDVLFLDYPEYFPKVNSLINKISYKYSANKSEIVLTGSNYSKERLENHFRIKNVHVQVYGVEDVFFEAYNKDEIKQEVAHRYGVNNYLIYISRHEPRKNHFLLLKSFIDLKLYENHDLVFIGDITFRDPKFDELMGSLETKIKNKIKLLNKVEFKEMILLLRGADIAIYPSIAEGFGLPPLESAAAQVPTICSNATSMAEFDFFNEEFIDPYDIEDIKTKVLKKLENQDKKRLKELAVSIKQKYNWNASAATFIKILNQDNQQ
ncbi:glycosyltransferase family 1 protein [Mariniflexile soesokkakense]|uniref:Glycosyltransferase family 1 protein n=1 Tax=Mariniflexile soesokkakense TaxID=1343160 RepID=A0ABV0AAE4_9FLAO